MNVEDSLKITANKIDDIIRDIQAGSVPNEEELQDVLDCLKGISLLSESSTGKIRIEEDEIPFDKMFLDFDDRAESSKEILKTMLSSIQNKEVPSEEILQKLSESIKYLKDIYDAIYSASKTILSNDEIPSEGSSINKIHAAIERSQLLQHQEKLLSVYDTLNRFMAVRSMVPVYADALLPFQNKASSTISNFAHIANTSLDDLMKITQEASLFLGTLDCQNLDSVEGLEWLERISATFPRNVEIGLSRQKYFIDENALERAEEAMANLSMSFVPFPNMIGLEPNPEKAGSNATNVSNK